MNKKKLIRKYNEKMSISKRIYKDDKIIPLEEDPAWIGLSETFHLRHPELSEKVDALLYQTD